MSEYIEFLENQVQELEERNERLERDLATVREYALELLLAIDKDQPSYQPRIEKDVVELVRGLYFDALGKK